VFRGGPFALQKGGPPGSVGGLSWRCVRAWISIPFSGFKVAFFGVGTPSGRSMCASKGCSPGVRGWPCVVKEADLGVKIARMCIFPTQFGKLC